MEKVVRYLVYGIAIFILSFWGTNHAEDLRITMTRTYKPMGYMIFYAIYPVLIGLFLSFPGLYSNIKRNGHFRLDWIRLTTVGIPALILTLSQMLYFFTPLATILKPVLPEWGIAKEGVIIGGVIFGYTLLSSLKRVDSTNMG